MQDDEPRGLRDRKRQATRERLERAAVEIVTESGLDALTIEALSERAEVSPRTFFNYFDSKEDAILGLPIGDEGQRLIEDTARTTTAATLREGVLQLLTASLEQQLHDRALHKARKRIVREHPELLRRQFTKMNTMMDALTRSARILADRSGLELDGVALQMLVMTCGAAVHGAFVELAERRDSMDASAAADLVRTRADQLLSETMGRLR